MPDLIASPLLDSSLCILDLKTRSRDSALGELAQQCVRAGGVRDAEMLREALQRRERLGSTAVGKGLAFPNARTLSVRDPRILLARSTRGLEWEAPDALPVHIVCAVFSPAEWSEEAHHDALGRAVSALRLQRQRARLLDASDLPALQGAWRELMS
jgi:mannitol/fructose-specific phosphotransferase system IIA component (Ntr-type)